MRGQRYKTIPLSEVPDRLNPDNKRQGDVGEIVELIRCNGFAGACLTDASTGFFVAGNHRAQALMLADAEVKAATKLTDDDLEALDDETRARAESWRSWPGRYGRSDRLPIIEREFTPEEAQRQLIGDNVASDKAVWDELGLIDDLRTIVERDGSLAGTGFDGDDLDALIAAHAQKEADNERSDGSMLTRTDVSVADPQHLAEGGQCYRLGRHVLCVVDLMADWSVWVPYLEAAGDDALFIPYPGPYIPLAERALRKPLVMVQPDSFIAGHLLDKWAAVHGEGSYQRIEETHAD